MSQNGVSIAPYAHVLGLLGAPVCVSNTYSGASMPIWGLSRPRLRDLKYLTAEDLGGAPWQR